jgi:hypothetical protein
MEEHKPTVPLANAIADLRAELLKALQEGAGKDLQFRLKPIELELKLAITAGGEANAGIKFWVVEIGGKGTYDNAATHTLKLTLEPVGPDGGDVKISSAGIPNPMQTSRDRK